MTKLLTTLSLIGLMALTPLAYAQAPDLDNLSYKERHEKFNAMTPEARTKYFADRKAQWEKMTKEEKLKNIEEHRAKRIQHMEEKWKGMSDDEKIKQVEGHMQRKHERYLKKQAEKGTSDKAAPEKPAEAK